MSCEPICVTTRKDGSHHLKEHCCIDGSSRDGEGGGMKRNCRSRSPIQAPSVFAGFRFPPDVILLAVRGYLRH